MKAFTLIEMLVVVAIIVIILSLTMPAVQLVLADTRRSASINLINAAIKESRAYARKEQRIAGILFEIEGDMQKFSMVEMKTTPETAIVTSDPVLADRILREITFVPNHQSMNMPTGWRVITGHIEDDANIDSSEELATAQTFCILFRSSGTLYGMSSPPMTRPDGVTYRLGGLSYTYQGTEYPASTGFYLYELNEMNGAGEHERFTGCVGNRDPFLIQMYAGGIMNK